MHLDRQYFKKTLFYRKQKQTETYVLNKKDFDKNMRQMKYKCFWFQLSRHFHLEGVYCCCWKMSKNGNSELLGSESAARKHIVPAVPSYKLKKDDIFLL